MTLSRLAYGLAMIGAVAIGSAIGIARLEPRERRELLDQVLAILNGEAK